MPVCGLSVVAKLGRDQSARGDVNISHSIAALWPTINAQSKLFTFSCMQCCNRAACRLYWLRGSICRLCITGHTDLQGAGYGMTPQQLLQAQQMYAAQQMQMAGGMSQAAYGTMQVPSQPGSPWVQQQSQSFNPSFQIQQHQFSSVAGPSGFP